MAGLQKRMPISRSPTRSWSDQIGITLTDVFDRLVHPVDLILFFGVEHTAPVDVTEQFVTSSIEELLFRHLARQCLLLFWGAAGERAFSAPGRDLSFSRVT